MSTRYLTATTMLLAMLVTGCADGGQSSSREALEAAAAKRPDVPVVVPTSIPEGYEMRDSVSYSGADDGHHTSSVAFTPVDGPRDAGPPVVEICVLLLEEMDTCAATRPVIATREVDGLRVEIVSMGPGPAAGAELWRDVELTTRWRDVDWLRDR